MIRKFQPADLPAVMALWLEGNLTAHSFVPRTYWTEREEQVRAALPQAEVYVSEREGEILGFVGLDGGYIAGIFVGATHRSTGVGRGLLNFVKGRKPALWLRVYEENGPAVRFYLREDFRLRDRHTDRETGRWELTMAWGAAGG